jgi:hypothetical protein
VAEGLGCELGCERERLRLVERGEVLPAPRQHLLGAALALGSLVAFASAELLLGQAPIDADREEVIATWVEMVMGLLEG